jgi:hypothetical protein
MRYIFSIFIFIFSQQLVWAQTNDSIVVTKKSEGVIVSEFPDSVLKFRVDKPNPKRAGLYAACLPGLGQLYNKQYWKVGLVYVGAGVITGFVISNYKEYNKYRKVYVGMIDSNPETPNTYENYTVDDVKYLRDGFRQYLEYSIMAAGLGYILNILDAFISAHLKSFDMSKDISYKMRPTLNSNKQVGFALNIQLK